MTGSLAPKHLRRITPLRGLHDPGEQTVRRTASRKVNRGKEEEL